MNQPADHAPCWHLDVTPHRIKHGKHAPQAGIALSEPPATRNLVCCGCGASIPEAGVQDPLPTEHPS
jgi:hypothetical protein